MIPDPHSTPTLTVTEAGKLLGLGRSAAYAAVERGEIPVLRFGRRLSVPTRQVLAMLSLDPSPDVNGPPP